MSVFTSAVTSWTPTATADGAQLTASGYHALRTASAGDNIRILEILVVGEASATAINANALRRHTTHSSTPTNRVPAPANPLSVNAATFQGFITASTNPTVAALATIQHVLTLSINAFGGILRWSSYQTGAEIWCATATANNDEVSIATVTGTSVQSTHYVVEEI